MNVGCYYFVVILVLSLEEKLLAAIFVAIVIFGFESQVGLLFDFGKSFIRFVKGLSE